MDRLFWRDVLSRIQYYKTWYNSVMYFSWKHSHRSWNGVKHKQTRVCMKVLFYDVMQFRFRQAAACQTKIRIRKLAIWVISVRHISVCEADWIIDWCCWSALFQHIERSDWLYQCTFVPLMSSFLSVSSLDQRTCVLLLVEIRRYGYSCVSR